MLSTATIKYGFAPIALDVSEIYEINILFVNMCVIVYFIAYLVANYPSIYLLDMGDEQGKGVYYCLKIATFVQLCAAWGRFLAIKYTDNFYILLGFQCVGALAYPFF